MQNAKSARRFPSSFEAVRGDRCRELLKARRNAGVQVAVDRKYYPKYGTKLGTGQRAKPHLAEKENDNLAEREGFEPSIEFPLYTLSERAPSTTRPSLRWEPVGIF